MSEIVPEVVNAVTAAIAQIDPDQLNDREVIAYLAGISATASGMLALKPDLKAHADLVMDLANRVFYANKAAEARGYARAVGNLAATAGTFAADTVVGTYLRAAVERLIELSPEATKETTDHA